MGARLTEVILLKEMFEQVIQMKNYDLKMLLERIDQYHIEGKLTDEERLELTMQARKGAEPEYDYKGEINALWAAIRELQKKVTPPEPDRTGGAWQQVVPYYNSGGTWVRV